MSVFWQADNICYIKPCLVFVVLTGFVADMWPYANIDKQQGILVHSNQYSSFSHCAGL